MTAFASESGTFDTPNLDPKETLEIQQPVKTESKFEVKFATSSAKIDYDKEYKDDPETEAGIETTIQKGKDGKKITTTKITFYDGKEFDRDVVDIKTEKPQNEIISRGTKIVWHTLDTPSGQIKYWKKMRVWATQYDSHCAGCNDTTAIGMKQGKGVVAVDPEVIKLRSKMYIPGYGEAVAGDVGGAVNGKMIDVGFEDAHTSGWTSHYVDIYLM
jgi:3D (Asp-Asp-Asp) domain-containing protein